jgi:hypothetical protein
MVAMQSSFEIAREPGASFLYDKWIGNGVYFSVKIQRDSKKGYQDEILANRIN